MVKISTKLQFLALLTLSIITFSFGRSYAKEPEVNRGVLYWSPCSPRWDTKGQDYTNLPKYDDLNYCGQSLADYLDQHPYEKLNLNMDELGMITYYWSAGEPLNYLLREREAQTLFQRRDAIYNIDSVIKKAGPVSCDTIVYRGSFLPKSKLPKKGSNIKNNSYWSTTLDPIVAEYFSSRFSQSANDQKIKLDEKGAVPIIFEIQLKQGASALYPSSNHMRCEAEFLLPRRTEFKVISLEDRQGHDGEMRRYIKLESLSFGEFLDSP